MTAGKVVGIVFGSLILAIGIGLLIGGGTLVGVDVGFTDDEGFLTSPSAGLERDTYAIVGEALFEGDWIWWYDHPMSVRLRMTGDRPIFVGIAPRDDLEAFLTDVSYSEVGDFDFDEYRHRRVWATDYRDHIGPAVPALPSDQNFWHASAQGEGTQTVAWDIEPGEWMLVVMNADGSRGVDVDGTIAIEAPWLLGVGIGVLVAGFVIVAIGLALILIVAHGTRRGSPLEVPAQPEPTPSGSFPLTFRAELIEPLSPALWLVKWFLLIPHFFVLPFLMVGFAFSWLVSLFAILFTGRYPRGLFDYNVGVMRWTWRVVFYFYQALGTDEYPPFTLKAGGYPADLDIPYPERLSPGLALVKWWLLAIPHYIVVGVFQGGAGFYSCGLVTILTMFAAVSLLFTGKYPKDIFRLVVGMNRWAFRVLAYAALMTDRYPPFRLDE
ncbi:DUF4389 domain-containing protein [Candidatus Bipolaricaulota bacterium]